MKRRLGFRLSQRERERERGREQSTVICDPFLLFDPVGSACFQFVTRGIEMLGLKFFILNLELKSRNSKIWNYNSIPNLYIFWIPNNKFGIEASNSNSMS